MVRVECVPRDGQVIRDEKVFRDGEVGRNEHIPCNSEVPTHSGIRGCRESGGRVVELKCICSDISLIREAL